MDAATRLDGRIKQRDVALDRGGHRLSITLPERGAPFDVGEEEGDGRQPVDFVDLVRETCAALATNTVPIRVDVCRQDVVLAVDPNRIRQALENLLSNAIKFSPAGATVEVELDVESAGAGCWAVVTMSDQGPGIPPELLPRLFERFARGPGSSGLGIGLYLASRIVAAHGGSLTADPAPTIGARFQMKLPLADPPLGEGGG